MNDLRSVNSSELPRFYQIVDHASWLERFLPLGLQLVQLRIKDKPESFVKEQIAESKALCDEFGCQLVVNDHWQEAIDAGCDFVHLGQEDLVDADLEVMKTNRIKLGISTHDRLELTTALELNPEYIALGPIYHTILKAMKWEPQGVDRVAIWRQLVGDTPLVAIGGLTVERAPAVYDAGADSICVVTDVLLNDNPKDRLSQWLQLSQ